MITHDLANAQIFFILVSGDGTQLQEMTRDLHRSKYRYFLVPLVDKASLVESAKREIAFNGGRIPTVLLIDYRFARKDCEILLELARGIGKSSAIECIVTHPPALESHRQALLSLGARLFDGDNIAAITELTIH